LSITQPLLPTCVEGFVELFDLVAQRKYKHDLLTDFTFGDVRGKMFSKIKELPCPVEKPKSEKQRREYEEE
jgi:hypothetical protein